MKVDGLSIGLLLSMEDFGYQSLIQEMLPDLPLETADEGYSDKLKSAVEDYRAAYRAFDDAVETSGPPLQPSSPPATTRRATMPGVPFALTLRSAPAILIQTWPPPQPAPFN